MRELAVGSVTDQPMKTIAPLRWLIMYGLTALALCQTPVRLTASIASH